MNILDTHVSYLENAKTAIITKELSIKETLDRIQNGMYQDDIDILRRFLSSDEIEKYSERKKLLPGVCFCGTFDKRRRRENLKQYNRLIVIDVDKLKGGELQKFKSCCSSDEFVFAFWESPSGNGLKGLVALDYQFDILQMDINSCHKMAFRKLSQHFLDKYSITLDSSGSDITRLCFFSSDSELQIEENFKCFPVQEGDLEITKVKKILLKQSGKKGYQGARVNVSQDCLLNPLGRNNPRNRNLVQSIIKYLSKRQKSITNTYDKWYHVAFAVASTFTHDIGEGYYLKLCRLDGAKHDEVASKDMLKRCYANNTKEISFSTLIYFARLEGYKPKGEGGSEDGENQEESD